MKLWVRSQDKELLLQTKVVEIEFFSEEAFTLINTRFNGKNVNLGKYETKKRALEVLDEIQQRLMPYSEVMQDNEGITISYKNISTIIYEMPKE